MKISFSVNDVPVRLSEERFEHISLRHPEMKDSDEDILQTINNPEMVQRGDAGTLLAIKKFPKTPVAENKFLIVVYKELKLTVFYCHAEPKGEASGLSSRKQRFITGQILRPPSAGLE